MPNEKVSQMTMLTAAEIAASDIFLVGDMSAQESKRMTADQLLLYFESSGSFNALTAIQASTASYILGSRVDGIVVSASFSSNTVSSSHALKSDLAVTASYAVAVAASSASLSASFIIGNGAASGTASYAVRSGTATNAILAANLSYPNISTASYSISSSTSVSSSYSQTSSFADRSSTASFALGIATASYANVAGYANDFNSPIKAWAMITWSTALPNYYSPSGNNCVYLQNNVVAFNYDNTFTQGTYTWFTYDIYFLNPLPSTNYIVVGQAYAPYYHPQPGEVIFHPVYSNRTTESCRISIALENTLTVPVTDWFALVFASGSYPNDHRPYLTFQVIG